MNFSSVEKDFAVECFAVNKRIDSSTRGMFDQRPITINIQNDSVIVQLGKTRYSLT